MNSSKVVTIFTPEGERKRWRMLADRVPEFLAEYPVKEGWRHERQVLEASALTPNLVELHKAAIMAGRNPSDLGLPPLPRGLVFVDKLIDSSGNLVASASAASPAEALFNPNVQYRSKDYEAGESAAFQRLLAALGFGGEVFEEDESTTIRSSGASISDGSSSDDIPEDPSKQSSLTNSIKDAPDSVVAFRHSSGAALSAALDDDVPDVENAEDALAGVGLVDENMGNHAEGHVVATEELLETVVGTPEIVANGVSESINSTEESSAAKVKVKGNGRTVGDAALLAGMNRNITLLAKQAGVVVISASTINEAKAVQAKLMELLKN